MKDCVLLCPFHHQVVIHRWGWTLVLNPDGTTTAWNKGKTKVLHGHAARSQATGPVQVSSKSCQTQPAGGHQVAGPASPCRDWWRVWSSCAVSRACRRGQGGGLAVREPGPGQERGDVTQRGEEGELGGVVTEFGVQVPQHRADGGLAGLAATLTAAAVSVPV